MKEDNHPMATVENGEVLVDHEAAQAASRSTLENALQSVDNLHTLLVQLCKEQGRVAAAVNVSVKSTDGNVSFFITASDNLDETALAKAVILEFTRLFATARARKGASNGEV